MDDLSALYETLTRRFKHGNIAGDSGESIDAEQRVASAAGKMTTAVAAETIAANGNDNGEGGSDISGKGHAVPVGVQNDARESPPDIVQQNTNRHHFAYKPNLVVVDGGKPQVMAAAKALEDCGVNDVAVCGLAKRLEEVWVPDDDYPIILKRQSEGMYLLQRVRDESHRFAITYHRQQRRKGALRSALDEIPGIGESYQKRLLNHFGSVKAMREASVEDFEKVKGIGHAKAEGAVQRAARAVSRPGPAAQSKFSVAGPVVDIFEAKCRLAWEQTSRRGYGQSSLRCTRQTRRTLIVTRASQRGLPFAETRRLAVRQARGGGRRPRRFPQRP